VFELVNFVVLAERDSREKNMNMRMHDQSHAEPQIWLWRHKVALLAAGVLALLIVGSKA